MIEIAIEDHANASLNILCSTFGFFNISQRIKRLPILFWEALEFPLTKKIVNLLESRLVVFEVPHIVNVRRFLTLPPIEGLFELACFLFLFHFIKENVPERFANLHSLLLFLVKGLISYGNVVLIRFPPFSNKLHLM